MFETKITREDAMKPETTQEDMTIAELQAEIGRLQQILFRKVAGDPVKGVFGDQAGGVLTIHCRDRKQDPTPFCSTGDCK